MNPDIAEPPLTTYFLFENPLLPICLLLAIFLPILILNKHRLTHPPIRNTLIALIIPALSLFILATAITTDREQIQSLTTKLVSLTHTPQNITPFITKTAKVIGKNDRILITASQLFKKIDSLANPNLKSISHTILSLKTQVESTTLARTRLRVFSSINYQNKKIKIPSTWIIQWRKASPNAPWLITQCQCIRIFKSNHPDHIIKKSY